MEYLATLEQLKAASDEATFVDTVSQLVGSLIAEQTYETTLRYRKFVLANQAELHVRLQGLLDHLDRGGARIKERVNEIGVLAGWRVEDRSTKKVDHLVIGIPTLFALHIITLIDEPLGKKVIQGVYGCFLRHDWQSYPGMPTHRTTRVSTIEQAKELMTWLDKLGKSEPIKEVVKDEKNTMKYTQKMYEARWGGTTVAMGTKVDP